MGDHLGFERHSWFHHELRRRRYPNAARLAERSARTAGRAIAFLPERPLAPPAYYASRNGYFYTESTAELPGAVGSEEELLGVRIAQDSSPPAPKVSSPKLSDLTAGSRTSLGHLLSVQSDVF